MRLRLYRLLLFGLAILSGVSLWRMMSVEREKRRVASAYEQAQQTLKQLEEERVHLNQELSGAHETIEKQTGEMANLQQELKSLGGQLEQTTTELSALQREHQQLRSTNASLLSERQQLEAKLSSIQELRLAIREVKRKMNDQRLAAWRAHIQAMKAADQQRLASGNRGYLVRGGVPTLGSRSELQVRVLQPQSQ